MLGFIFNLGLLFREGLKNRDKKVVFLKNAGQIPCLDLCATLGVSLAALLSYKVLKLKEIMGGLYNFNV